MTTNNKKLVSLSLLATAIPAVAFAQVIDRPANGVADGSNNTTLYIIIAAVVVVLVGGFLFFRSKNNK
jgi:LPXTG-motif cell wall-anchored protein